MSTSIKDAAYDYSLLLKWLSDLDVCQYYEGKSKPFDYGMILEKFEERAKGLDPVMALILVDRL